MKTAAREKRKPDHGVNRAHGAVGQNRSRSIKWAAKQEKVQPEQGCFFLTSPFIELLGARSETETFQILESMLLARARGAFDRHPAVAFALKEFQGTAHARAVGEVTEQTGLSARRFIDVFEKEVGLTPKLFCRVRRFQKVLRLIRSGSEIDWTEIALSCGYYDQAHFIHDFRAFSGVNPSTYVASFTPHMNHVPILSS